MVLLKKNRITLLMVLAVILAAGLNSTNGQAASPEKIGQFKKWIAYSYGSGKERVCYIVSEPRQSHPGGSKRGDILFMVTRRPAQNIANEISMRIGYIFKKTSRPYIKVGSDTFQMYTGIAEGGESAHWAWLENPEDEARFVRAMRRGNEMTIKGTSSRGTLTTDRYSLAGVSAALNRIKRDCK